MKSQKDKKSKEIIIIEIKGLDKHKENGIVSRLWRSMTNVLTEFSKFIPTLYKQDALFESIIGYIGALTLINLEEALRKDDLDNGVTLIIRGQPVKIKASHDLSCEEYQRCMNVLMALFCDRRDIRVDIQKDEKDSDEEKEPNSNSS